jgi:hypothetical protein
MGEYHIASHNRDAAAQAVRQAIELFEACEAKHYLIQARSLLESI